MPHDIFISYSRRDLAAVKPIKEALEAAGFSCWMDLQGIESGTWEFSDHIIAAIDASTAVLFFLSTNSQSSVWALKEIGYARDEQKHVVLVRFNDDPLTKKFRFEFGRSDIIDRRIPEQKEKLLRDLREWTGKSQPRGPSSQLSGLGASSSQTGGLVECPVCGKKNRPEETFRCRECRRDNLCLRHQDEELFLCRDCVAKAKKGKPRDAAAERVGSRSANNGIRRGSPDLARERRRLVSVLWGRFETLMTSRGFEAIGHACQSPEGHRYFDDLDEWAKGMAKKRNAFFTVQAKQKTKPDGRYSETVDGLTWNYEVKDGEVILGASDNDWSDKRLALSDAIDGPVSVVIPAFLGGCPVTAIGDLSFCDCAGLSAVIIPDSVTIIGKGAFSRCSGLQSVSIPASVTDIRCRAFMDCASLTSMTFPHGMTRIDEEVFQGCSGLMSVIIPDGVTRIDRYAFQDCSGLTTVFIPGSVTEIGTGAFYRCTNLMFVTIPDDIDSIEGAAFFGCDNLDDKIKRLLKARWPRSLEGERTPKPISAGAFAKLYDAAEAKRASQNAGQSFNPSRKSAKKGWSFWSW